MAVHIKNAIAAAIKYLESGINLATMATLKTLNGFRMLFHSQISKINRLRSRSVAISTTMEVELWPLGLKCTTVH